MYSSYTDNEIAVLIEEHKLNGYYECDDEAALDLKLLVAEQGKRMRSYLLED